MSHRSRVRPLLAVLLATLVVVAGVNLAAQAAGGKGTPVLAGKTTKTSRLTTLTRTKAGPALKLKTKAGAPPLAVTSSAKVPKLNADQVDGLDAADLATTTYAYQLPAGGTPATTQSAVFPDLPDGTYLVGYAVTLEGSAPMSNTLCFLRQDGRPTVIGLDYASYRLTYATASSNGRLDTTVGAFALVCTASQPFVFDSTDAGGSVVFTRTDLVEREAVRPDPPRAAPRGSGSGTATATGE